MMIRQIASPLWALAIGIGLAASSTGPVAAAASPAPLRFYVSPTGKDSADGSAAEPFGTLHRAQLAVRDARQHGAGGRPVEVLLADGTYYLCHPLMFTSEDSGASDLPVVWRAMDGAHPVLSGAVPLAHLKWEPYRDGIFRTE